MIRWLVALIVATSLAMPATAVAESAKRMRRRAAKLIKQGDHRGAADQLMGAYRAEPRARTLFLWAESERRDGNCELASRLYRQYLAKYAGRQHTAAVESGLDWCDDASADVVAGSNDAVSSNDTADATARAGGAAGSDAASALPRAGATAADVQTDVLVELPPDIPRRRRSITLGATAPEARAKPSIDKLGTILIVAGVGAIGVGTGYYMFADNAVDDLPDDATHDVVTRGLATADRRRVVGATTLVVGATATTLGVFRIITRRRQSRKRVDVQPYATEDGAGVTVSGQF